MAVRNLIFDVGLFDGSDTGFYLAKGFRVVAVEARPDLCAMARAKFSPALQSGQLTIVERAIWPVPDVTIPFYVRSGWSSVFRLSAERDGQEASSVVQVKTTTLSRLFEEFGVPYYLKCDIEGAEQIVVDALKACGDKPSFVSLEDENGELAEALSQIGYDRFQMVNQGHLRLWKPPRPAREGNYVDIAFTGTFSGLFGRELEPSYWTDYSRFQERLQLWHALRDKTLNPVFGYACRRWGKLTRRGWLIPGGWADVHATTAATLEMT